MSKFESFAALPWSWFESLLLVKGVSLGGDVQELVSVSLWGEKTDPAELRISAVWKDRSPNGWTPQTAVLKRRSELPAELAQRATQGENPVLVGATWDGDDDAYVLVVFQTKLLFAPPNALVFNLPHDPAFDENAPGVSIALKNQGFFNSLQFEISNRRVANYRLHWLVPYASGKGANRRALFAAIFKSQQKPHTGPPSTPKAFAGITWGTSIFLDAEKHDQAFKGMTAATSRPRQVAPLKLSAAAGTKATLSYTTVWHGDMIKPYGAAHGLSLATVQSYCYSAPGNKDLMQIQGSGPVDAPVFAVMWGVDDASLPRKGVVKGRVAKIPGSSKQGKFDFSKVDGRMFALLADNGIRRAEFALYRGDKLLATRAYTRAEDEYDGGRLTDYRDVMRIGSVSKAITGAAVLRALEDHPSLSVNDTIHDLVGWSTADSAWGVRTLRQLLRHQSGIQVEPSLKYVVDVYNEANGTQLTLPLVDPKTWDPYLKQADFDNFQFSYSTKFNYTNTAFVAAGEIAASLSVGVGGAYAQLVLGQFLQPARAQIVVAGELFEERVVSLGEPLYHPGIPRCVTSSYYPDGRLVPVEYSGANVLRGSVAAGGWAASAVDLARFFSRLESGPVPLLANSNLFFEDGSKDGLTPILTGGSIRPGLGWDAFFSLTPGSFFADAASKNGGLPGSAAIISRRLTDGLTIIIVVNGQMIVGAPKPYSFGSSHAAAFFADLPGTLPTLDLFPAMDVNW